MLNPWVAIVVGIGIVMIIVGYKGTQANLLAAVTGKAQSQKTAMQTGFVLPNANANPSNPTTFA